MKTEIKTESEEILFMYFQREKREDFIEADFKPYQKWTVSDKKEYAARALRRHRRKIKLETKKAEEDFLVLKEIYLNTFEDLQSLKQNIDIMEHKVKYETELWSQNFLEKQNYSLRTELLVLREEKLLLCKFQKLLCFSPKVDPQEFISFLTEKSQNLEDYFYNFKQRRTFVFENTKIGLEREVTKLRKSVNKELSLIRKIQGSVHRIAIDRKKKNFLLLNIFLENIKYENLIEKIWNIFSKQFLFENYYENINKIVDFKNSLFPNLNQEWSQKNKDSKTQIFSCLEKKTGKKVLFVLFLNGKNNRSSISCQKLVLNEKVEEFLPTKIKYIIYLEKTSKLNDKAKINMCFLHEDPKNLISKILSRLELIIKGKNESNTFV
eukprot:snap_masked-scaffold_19-processed-gene-5.36-mRNA-1 protein AED:1.00 eAED:1.00 QI:0/0/0/0/1/1/2/0/379